MWRQHLLRRRSVTGLPRDCRYCDSVPLSAEESRRRLGALFEEMQFLAVLKDGQGRIDYCNDALLRLSGYGREDVLGKNWFDLFVPAEQREPGRSAYLAGDAQREEERELQTANGERRVIQWNVMPLREGGCAALGVDVTERSRAAQKLLHGAFHDSLT